MKVWILEGGITHESTFLIDIFDHEPEEFLLADGKVDERAVYRRYKEYADWYIISERKVRTKIPKMRDAS